MVDKLLQSLKTKYAHLGLGEVYLKAVATRLATAVKEDSEIENAITSISDEFKALQSVTDKQRTNASKAEKEAEELRKELEALKAKQPNPNPQPPTTPAQPQPDEMPAWAKTLVETVNKQNETITALQTERTRQSTQEAFKNKLTAEGVSEAFYKLHLGREFKDEDEMNAFVAELKANEQAFLQSQTNTRLNVHSNPIVGGGLKENEPSAEVQSIFKKQ